MRRLLVLLVALALVLTACSADTESADTSSTSTTTTTTTSLAVAGPMDVVEQVMEAIRTGDSAGWRTCFSSEAVTVLPNGEEITMFDDGWPEYDFDGDGITAVADAIQFEIAFNARTGTELEWECTERTTDQVECMVTIDETFSRVAGLEPAPDTVRYTVADGLIVSRHFLSSPGTWTDDEVEMWFEAITAYQRWVYENHTDIYWDLFEAQCCRWDVKFEADNLGIHEQLVAEYLASLESEAAVDGVPAFAEPLSVSLGVLGPEVWMFEIGLDGEGRAVVAYQTLEDEGSDRFSIARCKDRNCSDLIQGRVTVPADMAHLEAVVASPSGAPVIYLPVSSHSAGLVGSMAVTCKDLSCSEPEFHAIDALVFDAVPGLTALIVGAYDDGNVVMFACDDSACSSGIATSLGAFHGPSVSGLELMPDGRPVMFYGGAVEEGEPGNLVAVCEDDICSDVAITNLAGVESTDLGTFVPDHPMHAVGLGADSVVFGCLDESCDTWGQSVIEGRSVVRWARIVTDDAGMARPVLVVTEAETALLVVCDGMECTQAAEVTLGVDDFQFARATMDETGALFIVCRDNNEIVLTACPSPFDCEGR